MTKTPKMDMIFVNGVGAFLFEALCQLGVGLMCFYIGTAQLKKCLVGLESGSLRRHRIQSVEGLVLDPRAQETCLKRDQKWTP